MFFSCLFGVVSYLLLFFFGTVGLCFLCYLRGKEGLLFGVGRGSRFVWVVVLFG